MRCPSCQEENPKDARFCMRCAVRLTPACERCGAELPAAARFCPGCALPVEAGPRDQLAAAADPEAGSHPPALTALGSGRYEVKRFLGEGAKKRVYLAWDTRLDRDVAIGVIKTEGLDPNRRRRVEHEVRAMGRLGEHPHIVNVYDVADDGGLLYLVGQYVAGGDLERRLQETRDHRLPLEDTLRMAGELCQALEHAHGQGIVHRDIKPANVYLAEDGAAKLGDFGLAVSLDRTRLTE